jgi:glucose 1-dehydrogenase
VNNIGPGAIYTPIDKDVEEDKTINDEILAEIPLGRRGQPEEIGDLAVFLASDKASYITGSNHFIDSGMLRNAGSL